MKNKKITITDKGEKIEILIEELFNTEHSILVINSTDENIKQIFTHLIQKNN